MQSVNYLKYVIVYVFNSIYINAYAYNSKAGG